MHYNLNLFFNNTSKYSFVKNFHNLKLGKPNIHTTINIDKYDLIWGSIYANRENRCKNPKQRLNYDISLVEYLFNLNSHSDLKINQDILLLEQTQKTSMMTRAGVILCNVTAKKYFNVKHLHHLQKLNGMSVLNHSGLSPDFVARLKNNYFVFEAKGTSLKSCFKQLKSGINQLNSISTINGTFPEKYIIQTTICSCTFSVNIVDPNGGENDLNLTDDFFTDYKLDIKNGIQVDMKELECSATGYFINDFFIGYIDNSDKESKNNDCKDCIIEKIILNNKVYKGKVFADKTVILEVFDNNKQ